MDTTSDQVAGRRFESSPKGYWRQRAKVFAFLLPMGVGLWVSEGVPDGVGTLPQLVVIMSLWTVFAFTASRFFPPNRLPTRVAMDGHRIRTTAEAHEAPLPWCDIKRVKIQRSYNGRHRIVRLWDNTGTRYDLFDPNDGDAIEQWVAEIAPLGEIRVKTAPSLLESYEPFSSFVLGAVGITLGIVISRFVL